MFNWLGSIAKGYSRVVGAVNGVAKKVVGVAERIVHGIDSTITRPEFLEIASTVCASQPEICLVGAEGYALLKGGVEVAKQATVALDATKQLADSIQSN